MTLRDSLASSIEWDIKQCRQQAKQLEEMLSIAQRNLAWVASLDDEIASLDLTGFSSPSTGRLDINTDNQQQIAGLISAEIGCTFVKVFDDKTGNLAYVAELDNGIRLHVVGMPDERCNLKKVVTDVREVEVFHYEIDCSDNESNELAPELVAS